ncbi:Protein CBG27214 [Caenorhabditis briggsae]|uniref:EGF domain-specific O-linked N-acetylglucosamine transferase n=1 Tax=Caenorhabditis briggsae TaxID=6238 RepID=E3CU25_CAEBR|nr:Protein CBG27214 [Caenorhabditis briggsae]CBX33081.1 Protein CBG27214 [Caenorhabditis briggsae]
MSPLFCTFILLYFFIVCESTWVKDLNLPRQLLEYHISSNKNLRDRCSEDPTCKINLNASKCFGFEDDCINENSLGFRSKFTSCDNNLNPKVAEKFYEQGDFGYLESRLVKHSICSSDDSSKSSLSCSDHLTHCIGSNIYFDFSNLKIKSSTRYRQDVIQPGQVEGNCENFDRKLLDNNLNVKGYLMSWADELQHFKSNLDFKMDKEHCDVIFEKPTVVMKLDAAVNLYHHFCDFVNLYASLHINQTFNQDIDIILWDTHPGGYNDHYYGITWKAFSRNEPFELKEFGKSLEFLNYEITENILSDQKRVCFKNVMMPLLARQRSGLFYNSPLVYGCSGSTLLKTFSQFILHRLGIKPQKAELEKVRIVILSRSTAYRRILNIKELLKSLGHLPNVTTRVVDYNERIPFLRQLNTTSQTDIFIGMHGAGLTHLLFLPDWAAIFEIISLGLKRK